MSRNNSSSGDNGYICCHCNLPNPLKNYYKSISVFHSASRHLPICKNCLNELFNMFAIQYNDRRKAMQKICMTYDIYYNDALFESCDNGSPTVIGDYMKKLNLSQHKEKTFDSSIEEGFYFSGNKNTTISHSDEDSEQDIDPKLIEKWGNIFSADDYIIMEDHYRKLKKNNPNLDSNQEIFVTSLCHIYMLMMKALKSNDFDSYSKANEQYNKTFTKAGLKVVQEIDMGAEDCWGEWVKRIEEYTPAEYYKNKSLFKDFDGVGEYFQRFILRPLKNLIHGTTDRDSEYSVQDGDEYDSEPE